MNRPTRKDFLYFVEAERQAQTERWSQKHDRAHSWIEWAGILSIYVGRLAYGDLYARPERALIAIAALALAAWEAQFTKDLE